MEELRKVTQKVQDVLIKNNFSKEADELKKLIKSLDLMYENHKKNTNSILGQIIQRSNIRWLGDLNIESMTFSEWSNLLEKLYKSAQKNKVR